MRRWLRNKLHDFKKFLCVNEFFHDVLPDLNEKQHTFDSFKKQTVLFLKTVASVLRATFSCQSNFSIVQTRSLKSVFVPDSSSQTSHFQCCVSNLPRAFSSQSYLLFHDLDESRETDVLISNLTDNDANHPSKSVVEDLFHQRSERFELPRMRATTRRRKSSSRSTTLSRATTA